MGADNGLFKIKSGLGARLKTLANPTTAAQRTEMSKWKKGNETNPKKAKRDEKPAAKKTRKRRLTDTIIQSESLTKRKKRDTWTTEEKEGTTGRQRRGDKKDIEAEDAEQPQVVEQEKETRSRRKRVRITITEDNTMAQKPTTETSDNVKASEMKTHEKNTKRTKLEHRERDPPD